MLTDKRTTVLRLTSSDRTAVITSAMKMRVLHCALLATFCAAAAADDVVVTAIPTSRVLSTSASTERHKMSDEEQTKALLVIQKTSNGYRWASRENRELVMRRSGAFAYFIDLSGGGYIKTAVDRGAAALIDDSCKDGFAYFEHVSMGVATLTYWGCAAEVNF